MKVIGNMCRIWNSWKLNVDETCFATTAIAMLPIKTVQRIYFGDAHTTWNSAAVHPWWLREIWPWFGMRARRTHINPIKRTWNEMNRLIYSWILIGFLDLLLFSKQKLNYVILIKLKHTFITYWAWLYRLDFLYLLFQIFQQFAKAAFQIQFNNS